MDFELVTGHNSLEILYGRKCRPNAWIERWLLVAFNSKVKYLLGHQTITDCLSQLLDKHAVRNADSQDMEVEEYVKFMAREVTPKAMSTRRTVEWCPRPEHGLSICALPSSCSSLMPPLYCACSFYVFCCFFISFSLKNAN